MSARHVSFFTTHKRTLLALIFGLAFSATLAYAVPPSGGYNAGATLDPDCAPGTTDCIVNLPAGGSSQWDDVTGGINYAGGKVGIGTTTPTTALDVVGTITGSNLNIVGDTATVLAPTNLSVTQTQVCTPSCGYVANGGNGAPLNYRIYAYKTFGSIRVYSASYLTLGANFVDDGSNNPFDVTVSWTASPGADGYRILIYSPTYYGANYDAGYDTTGTSFIDDGGNNVYFDNFLSAIEVTPSSTYSNTATINGSLTLSGPILMNSNTLSADSAHNIIFGTSTARGGSGNFIVGDGAGNGIGTTSHLSNAVFIGFHAGDGANNAAYSSSFIGSYAGYQALDAEGSNFFGERAGYQASSAAYSNFLGYHAGNLASNASGANFFGQEAGAGAINAANSNFLGGYAGNTASYAYFSNFFGFQAGLNAENAMYANFFGMGAGAYAYEAANSIFIGQSTGSNAYNAANSIFIGQNAGANDAVNNILNNKSSILIGAFTNTGGFSDSIALGAYAVNTAANQFIVGSNNKKISSVFIGGGQGVGSTNGTIFIGDSAGQDATNANNSNFFGINAGFGAIDAPHSNFFGYEAGYQSGFHDGGEGFFNSNFFGYQAGYSAAGAHNSNFFGYKAGYETGLNTAYDESFDSNFFGRFAGYQATDAVSSNFFGAAAGQGAINANDSNFFGAAAGQGAINARDATFIGPGAGFGAINASNAIFIGKEAGINDTTIDNTVSGDDFSILLGPNTSTGGFSNSIAIGGYATNTTTNQFMIGSTTRRIDTMVFNGGTGNTCSINASTGITCSSDERLKTNIEDLDTTTLDKVLALKTVTYNWNSSPEGERMIGFIAQNLQESFPQLVSENIDGMLSVNYAQMTPILVEAIREMNLKIVGINDLTKDNSWRSALIEWFASATNGITSFFAGEVTTKTLCVADDSGAKTCLTKGQLDALLGGSQQTVIINTPSIEPTPEPVPDPAPTETPADELAPAEEATETIVSDPTLEPTPVQEVVEQVVETSAP